MVTNILVYTVFCDNSFQEESKILQSRWKTEKIWREFRQDLLNVFRGGDNSKIQAVLSRKNFLMKATSPTLYEKKFDLVDLRGIELKNIQFKDFDFSYCSFDFSQLNNVTFNKTSLQYSSFNSSIIKKSKFIDVQASPISAFNAKFEDVIFDKGFFMHSDFRNSSFVRCDNPLLDLISSEQMALQNYP